MSLTEQQHERRRKGPRPVDLTGATFGRLVVLSEAARSSRDERMVLAVCQCGTSAIVRIKSLRSGNTTSCGCAQREVATKVGQLVKHGASRVGKRTAEYRTWCGMVRRCEDPGVKNFTNYGGRGIRVCDQWRESFEAFLSDVGPRPSPDHSIDRYPDNDGNYKPGNVRWATAEQQQNNRRGNRRIAVGGRSLTLSQWARETGLDKTTLKDRLNAGWNHCEAVAKPARKMRKRAH